MTLTLPDWMVQRIVEILSKHKYTGAYEIIREIKEQVKTPE